MTKVLTDSTVYPGIASAIRAKNGASDTYTPSEMAGAIAALNPDSSTFAAKFVGANGTYSATDDNVDGYSSLQVAVPNSYATEDEGCVVDNGVLVQQTARTITANGEYDTTTNDALTVNVPTGGGSSLGEKSIAANGEYRATDDDLDGYSHVTVDVSNTYTSADEGKVVDNGALVAQTSLAITANGTYDTELISEVSVNVESGGRTLPNDYQQVEYIEVTSYEHIRVPFVFERGDFVFGAVSRLSGTGEAGFAGRHPQESGEISASGTWDLYFSSGTAFADSVYTWDGYGGVSTQATTMASISEQETVSYGTKYFFAFAWISMPSVVTRFYLGCYRTDRYPFNGRIYQFRVIRNGDAVLDFVPCYRKRDSKPGFYDVVNSVFYTNEFNDGEFIIGGDVI